MRRAAQLAALAATFVVAGPSASAPGPVPASVSVGAPGAAVATSASVAATGAAASASASGSAGPAPSIGAGAPSSVAAQPGLPAGHPSVQGNDPDDGVPTIPRDAIVPDPSLPSGSIVVTLLDEANRPIPKATVKLTTVRSSVSEGEKRDTRDADTDGNGLLTFADNKVGTTYQYTLSVVATDPTDTAAFARYATEPFSLPLSGGFRVTLHRFPVTSKLDKLLAAVEGVDTVIEVRDDQIEVSQMFEVVNAGTTTWSLGRGLELALPKGFKAVRAAENGEGDHTAVGTDTGVRWAGSFAPGRSQLTYDFKVPYEGEASIDLDLPLPPRVLAARVRVAARKGMDLSVDGFPPTTLETMGNGLKLLSTVAQGSPQSELKTLHVRIKGLPSQGNDRWYVTAVALAAAAVGLWLAQRPPPRIDRAATTAARQRVRKALLRELVALERAHAIGEVGPKAYARERAKLLDAVADTLDPDTSVPSALTPVESLR